MEIVIPLRFPLPLLEGVVSFKMWVGCGKWRDGSYYLQLKWVIYKMETISSLPSLKYFLLTVGGSEPRSELAALGACLTRPLCAAGPAPRCHLRDKVSYRGSRAKLSGIGSVMCVLKCLPVVLKRGRRESKDRGVNAVDFILFNTSILVGKQLSCLAYVKLLSIFMRPFLTGEKLCKYINKF